MSEEEFWEILPKEIEKQSKECNCPLEDDGDICRGTTD